MKAFEPLPSSGKKLKLQPTKDRRRREHALMLTVQELELMKIIWDLGEASVAQVREIYQAEHDLAYTTIMTVLSRLEKKGMLKQRKSGKAFFYSTVHPREIHAEAAVDNLCRIFFNGSRKQLADFCRDKQIAIPSPSKTKKLPNERIDETLL